MGVGDEAYDDLVSVEADGWPPDARRVERLTVGEGCQL